MTKARNEPGNPTVEEYRVNDLAAAYPSGKVKARLLKQPG
jgi:hypothetical protein